MPNKNWHVIGICGATCSGKTTLANRIKENLKNTVVLHQDDYFLPRDHPRHVRIAALNHNNWELPSSVDMDKLYKDTLEILKKMKDGVLILDGFLIFTDKRLTDLCDLKFFVDLTMEVCWERRQKRNYDPPDVDGYFEQIVWPEFEKNKQAILRNKELKESIKFVNGAEDLDDIFHQVFHEVKMKVKG